MDNSKINQTELNYSCTAGSSKVNIFTGRLLFEFLNLSIGCGAENITVSHIYNSLFKLPAHLDTNMSSNWKLNVQQYLYKNEDDTFTYIDGSGRQHLFVLLENNVYYDTSGLGYELEETVVSGWWRIKDLKQNKLTFKDNKIYKIKLNNGVLFKYIYDSLGKLTKIELNDIEKVIFVYNDNNLLSEINFEDEKIKYYYNNKNQLVEISRVKEGYEKKVVKFNYTNNLLTLVTSLIDRTSLIFKYKEDLKIFEVRKAIFPHHLIDESEVGLYFGEEVYSGEEYYTGEEEKTVECGYNKFTYNVNGENSTRVSNEKFIIYKYYYNQDGNTLSVFEINPKNEKELISLNPPIGKTINLNGEEKTKINDEKARKFTSQEPLIGILNYEDLTESNIICSMWINLTKKTLNNKIKITLNDDDNYTTICNYDVKGINSWQQLIIPIDCANLKEINELSISFVKDETDESIDEAIIADLRVYPSSINKLILENNQNKEELTNITKLTYVRNGIEHTILLNGDNYITTRDLEMTFLRQIIYSPRKVLYINNGTKKIMFDIAELKSNKLIDENTYFSFNMLLTGNSNDENNKYILLSKTVDNEKEISAYYQYQCGLQLDDDYSSNCICYFITENSSKCQKKYYDIYGKLLMQVNEFGVKIINKYAAENSLLISQKYQDENNSYKTEYSLDKSQNAITKTLSNGFTESTFYDNIYINVKKEQYGDYIVEYDHSLFNDKIKKVKFNNASENIIEYDCDHKIININPKIEVNNSENTQYGYHFDYDEAGNLKKYFLTSGENNQNELLLFKTIYDEDLNCFSNYYSKNDFDVYFNFLEYDKYGRIVSYKGENPVYIKRDNEFGSGRITEVTEKITKGINDIVYNHKFEYDDVGNISKYTIQKDGIEETVIKNIGNSKEYNFNSNKFKFILENSSDNALSNLVSESTDNDISTNYKYDSSKRIKEKSTKGVVEKIQYYNNTNIINNLKFNKTNSILAENSVSLDDGMRITGLHFLYKYGDYENLLSSHFTYEYNNNNQLYKEFSPIHSTDIEYIYSADGSLQEIRKYGIVNSDNYSVYKKYKYDKGRLVSLDIDNRKMTFSYDEYGNCTYYNGNSLTWNNDRLLSKVERSGDVITYKYDCFGNRTEKSRKLNSSNYTSTYKYYYDLDGKLIFEDRGYDKLKYNYDITGLNGFTYYKGDSSNTYIYLKDALGDIFAIVDESTSNIVAYYEYDAWGEHRVRNNLHKINTDDNFIGNINPFRYRGYYYDVETGWFWLSSRYYSPELGRFIQPADVSSLNPSSINGLNLYSYANNNPISIVYSSSGSGANGGMVSSLSLGGKFTPSNSGFGGNFTKDWINLKSVLSWGETAIDIADVGFSASIVGLTAWYTLKYPGVADLMKLDGIASIPGKYADFVEGLGYAFVFVETGIDVYNNWQKGQSAGYIFASGAYTFGTGMAITWVSSKLGSYIGTTIGGPVGFIVGGVAGILIGLGLERLSDEIKELIF